jgi:hypothetical protein
MRGVCVRNLPSGFFGTPCQFRHQLAKLILTGSILHHNFAHIPNSTQYGPPKKFKSDQQGEGSL